MHRLLATIAAGLLVIAAISQGRAAKDFVATPAQAQSGLVLLVFETADCAYCRLFRRDVLPAYEQSARAQRVPMRFVDARKTDLDKLGLDQPIRLLPTVVLMRNGEEVDRLAGYTGPEIFFHAIAHMLGKAE